MRDYAGGVVLSFDKPLHWTSFDLVGKVRNALSRRLGQKRFKVGHAGTLDPLATGVVLVCTGRATKQIETLMNHTKEYVATMQLGATTPCFDMEKPVDRTYPTAHISRERIDAVLPRFLGEIEQVPPVFSAIKVAGKRAYDMARKGEAVELAPKRVRIDELEVLGFDAEQMQLTVRVVCSRGTYIRAFARDFGEALESGAYLTALRRTRVGNYRVDDAITIETFLDQLTAETD